MLYRLREEAGVLKRLLSKIPWMDEVSSPTLP